MERETVETIYINSTEISINVVDIISRQKRRLVHEDYIQEVSSTAHSGKYSEAKFTLIMQFNIEDMLSEGISVSNPPALVKVITHLDKYPFVFIRSKRLESYLSPTSFVDNGEMMFGIDAFTIGIDSQANNVVTLTLDVQYFNHLPMSQRVRCQTVSSRTGEAIPEERTRVINGEAQIEYDIGDSSIRNCQIFDSYFLLDYAEKIPNIIKYTKGKPLHTLGLTYPTFSLEEPETEHESFPYTEIEKEEGQEKTEVYHKTAYVQWINVPEISQINKSDSPITEISITRRNNFASHSMTAWTYPTLQYMGKGATSVDFTIVEDTTTGNTIDYIKYAMNALDVNQRTFSKFTSHNVIKLDNILFDLLPVYGVIFEEESIRSTGMQQEQSLAYFSWIEKNITPLIGRQRATVGTNISGSYDLGSMLDIMLGMSKNMKSELERAPGPTLGIGKISNPNGPYKPYRSSKIPQGLSLKKLENLDRLYGLEPSTLYNVMWAESAGDPNAESGKGAVGAFQFLKPTAEQYGLYDRTDPVKSALAAAKYMHYLKNRFGSTELALAAYNHGEGNLKKYINKEGYTLNEHSKLAAADPTGTFLDIRPYIPKETKDYVGKIITGVELDGPGNSIRGTEKFNYGNSESYYVRHHMEIIESELSNLSEGINEVLRPEIYERPQRTNRRLTGVERNAKHKLRKEQTTTYNTLLYLRQKSKEPNIENNREFQIAVSKVEKVFLSIINDAKSGNAFAASFIGLASDEILKNINRINEEFIGEAYTGLELGKRTLPWGPVVGENGEVAQDIRDVNPMFFMEPGAYITAGNLRQGYRSYVNDTIVNREIITKAVDDAIKIDVPKKGLIGLATRNNTDEIDTMGRVEYDTLKTDDVGDEVLKARLQKQHIAKAFNKLNDEMDQSTIESSRGSYPLDMALQGPTAENAQAEMHFKRASATFQRGLNLAFPIIKIYVVDGNEDSLRANFSNPKHSFYELSGIVEARIVCQDDDSPVDVMHLRLANPGSAYTDNTVMMDEIHPEKDWEAKDTNYTTNIPLGKILLRPGNRLHVKAGYSNDINRLETMFNGIITDISGELTLDILAESFGRELVMYEHGDDPTDDDFWGGADTFEVVSNFVYASELEHFGNIKFLPGLLDREGSVKKSLTIKNLMSYAGSNALFVNVYMLEVLSGQYVYGSGAASLNPFTDEPLEWINLNMFSNKMSWPRFPIYKMTPWEGLKEMEYRHPGILVKACNFGDRQTLFFGIKEQLYVYRDLADEIQSFVSGPRIYDEFRAERLKPVSDFHIISSDLNIIHNGLRVVSDFDTVVSVRYYSNVKVLGSGFQASFNDFDYYEMKMDDNLRPMAHRLGRCEKLGIHGEYAAYCYGSTYLKKEAEKMYDGKILILGNQNLKSGDYAILDDSVRGINGIIKIRECIHHFDLDNGYVTEIRPGLFAESSHVDYSALFTKLYFGYMPFILTARVASIGGDSDNEAYLTQEKFFKDRSYIYDADLGNLFSNFWSDESAATLIPGIPLGGVVAHGTSAFLKSPKAALGAIGKAIPAGLKGFVANAGRSIGTFAARNAVGLVNAATTAGGWSRSILASSSLMSSGVIRGLGGLVVGTVSAPALVVSSLVLAAFSAKIEEKKMTRQPIRMFPLAIGHKPYIGGIWGYKNEGYIDDAITNLSGTIDDIGYIMTTIRENS